VTQPHRTLVLGHRGASAHARGNTLAAYRRAVVDGADGIECDARLTADGVVVMHHDPVVEGLGALNGLTFAMIRQKHPDIPTLDEMLVALPDPRFILNIEIKNSAGEPGYDENHEMARFIAEWTDAHHVVDRVVVTSFNRATIDSVKRIAPRIATGLLLGHRTAVRPAVRSVARDGHQWVLPHHSRLIFGARRTVASAHEAGLRVGTWTLDSRWRASALSGAEIDAIITNDPAAARSAIG